MIRSASVKGLSRSNGSLIASMMFDFFALVALFGVQPNPPALNIIFNCRKTGDVDIQFRISDRNPAQDETIIALLQSSFDSAAKFETDRFEGDVFIHFTIGRALAIDGPNRVGKFDLSGLAKQLQSVGSRPT